MPVLKSIVAFLFRIFDWLWMSVVYNLGGDRQKEFVRERISRKYNWLDD